MAINNLFQKTEKIDPLTQFRECFDSNYKQLRNYIYYKCGNVEMADDLCQETFIKVWEMWHKINQDTLKSLLYKIATNLMRNQIKHLSVVYQFQKNNKPHESDSTSADFELRQEEYNQLLEQTLGKIPEKSREVFLMSRIDGLTYNEIAERLGLSVKAIEKRMHLALEIISNKMSVKL